MSKEFSVRRPSSIGISLLCLSVMLPTVVRADSASWVLNPTSGNWNTAVNWSPASVPNGASEVAIFNLSNQTEISLSSPVTVESLTFAPGASSYNINCPATETLTLAGAGIVNRSGTAETITILGALAVGNYPGVLQFSGTSTITVRGLSSSVTIVNNGATVSDAPGGQTEFLDNSSAGGATFIANGGVNGGQGGSISFLTPGATGATARIQLHGNGTLYVLFGTSLGSISGDGFIETDGPLQLRGATDATTFSGVISGNGSLIKNGSHSSLTLSGANTYQGNTTLNAGTLILSNTTGSATGTGNVSNKGGILAGTGSIFGGLTLTGTNAMVSPGVNGVGTLTVGKKLTFNLNSSYLCDLDATGAADLIVSTKAVTISSGAVITISASATAPVGTVYTIIRSINANPIAGTFGNLPDGGTITAAGNIYQANYEGGDGNDLTFTVLP